ncbi:MAG: DUF1926 domain-containing protein [Nitrospinae bacterium]|nr:DUF1926 domain-containing protein [Nitrospinota bacterium]
MNKAYLMIGLHNHQPVGNFDHVFSESYDQCYLPTLETLERYPHLKISLHHSGPLIEWIERHKPEYIKWMRGMVKRGQVEILSGGFYEPILSSLPERDAVGQLEMMNRWVEKNFGVRPRGAWMAERIWDPSLPKILAAAGIEYTLLDDTHFFYAGLGQKDMYGYWVTEKHGDAVAVFPIDKELRYAIPFKQPEETLAYFRATVAAQGTTAFAYGDDGEKFGVWPETHEWVFGKKWLERFLNMLTENAGFVETVTYSQYLDRFPPRGRIYLPMASYEEMMHWTLPTEAAIEHTKLVHQIEGEGRKEQFKKFLRGGLWDNFLAKYAESNQMHKRMLYVSKRVEKALEKSKKGGGAITAALYRGQCNCPYWHGLFGGLYLSNLRHAVYSNLIDAGRAADAALHKGKAWAEVNTGDYLTEMRKEVAVETPALFALFTPAEGGALAELDFKPALFNLSNVMARRPEEYHQKILDAAGKSAAKKDEILSINDRVVIKEPGLVEKLVFDRHPRYSFIDHILAAPVTADDLRAQNFVEAGDFAGQPYALVSAKTKGQNAVVVMEREGQLSRDGKVAPLKIRKTVTVGGKDAGIACAYEITSMGGQAAEFTLGVEWNFTLLAADALDRYITVNNEKYRMNHKGENAAVEKWSMTDEYFRFTTAFGADAPVSLLRYPIETVSQSEGGFESTYQGICFTALAPLKLAGGETARRAFTIHCRMWND